jgi:hypothetical protein
MSERLPLIGPASSEVIDQVPSHELDRVTQDFTDSGAIDVKAEPNGDGTWKVTAMFPYFPSA